MVKNGQSAGRLKCPARELSLDVSEDTRKRVQVTVIDPALPGRTDIVLRLEWESRS